MYNVGLNEVIFYLHQIGWLAPLMLAPHLGAILCDTKGWACTLRPTASARPVPILALSRILLAGEAISHLTSTAQLVGEAVKVYLMRAYGVGGAAGLASVVAARVALTIAQVAFILPGLPFLLSRLGWGYHTWQRRGLMGIAVRTRRLIFIHKP